MYGYDGQGQVTGDHIEVADLVVAERPTELSRAGKLRQSVTQTRSANRQNEVTAISGSVTPTFDAAGNMTGDETGRQFTYDAWNRLVGVKSAGVLLKSYAYDGMGRRVAESPGAGGGASSELYYSADWQVLEERVGGVARASYVWSPVYVDALVARDRDADGDGSREGRLYVLADANHNVTAVVGVDGVVKERYAYDPFGVASVLAADGSARAGGSAYEWRVLFQGMAHDADAGLSHQRARWYSPTLGRWASVDPIGFMAGDVNLYRFVGNGPTVGLDPSGLLAGLPLAPVVAAPTAVGLGAVAAPVAAAVAITIAVPATGYYIGTHLAETPPFVRVGGGIGTAIGNWWYPTSLPPIPGRSTGMQPQPQAQPELKPVPEPKCQDIPSDVYNFCHDNAVRWADEAWHYPESNNTIEEWNKEFNWHMQRCLESMPGEYIWEPIPGSNR